MARDTYTKVHEDWQNDPSAETPIMAEDMEHIEAGIEDAMDNRALKDVYDDVGASIGSENNTYGTGNYVVVGNKNTLNGFYTGIFVGNENSGDNGGAGICSGYQNVIGGSGNLVSGNGNEAKEGYSAAMGQGLTAVAYQTVIGKYNQKDDPHRQAFIVGGGTSTNKKNIHMVDWQGNGYFAGDVTTESGASLNSIGLPENVDIDFSNYFT